MVLGNHEDVQAYEARIRELEGLLKRKDEALAEARDWVAWRDESFARDDLKARMARAEEAIERGLTAGSGSPQENPEGEAGASEGSEGWRRRVYLDGRPVGDVDVGVVFTGVSVPGEDGPGSLEFKVTHEGLVVDVYVDREGEGHNLSTRSWMADELVAKLVHEDEEEE